MPHEQLGFKEQAPTYPGLPHRLAATAGDGPGVERAEVKILLYYKALILMD